MDYDTDRETTLARDETHELISSEKVDGTSVYSRDGDKLGSIHHFMVGKRDGRVRFAVLNFGGLFEGDRYYPLPWNALTYNTELDGYEVGKVLRANDVAFQLLEQATLVGRQIKEVLHRQTRLEVRQRCLSHGDEQLRLYVLHTR